MKGYAAVEGAIRGAVEQAKQPTAVAEKLFRWFLEIAEGNEKVEDRTAAYARLDSLAEVMVTRDDEGQG